MKKVSKRIIAIMLTAILAFTVFPNMGAVRGEAATKSQTTAKAGDISAASGEREPAAGFVNVEVDTDAKTAEIAWLGNVKRIVVNLYEDEYEGAFEDETPVYEKSVDVSPSIESIVTTNISLDDRMPEYFMLEVLLQDGSGNNVCDPYMSSAYSEAIRTVSDKTAEDYRHEGDRLVEMAADSGVNDGSFIVLADDVLRIEEGSGAADGTEGTGGVQVDLIETNGGDYLCSLRNVDDKLSRQLKAMEKDAPVFVIDETYDGDEVQTGYHMFTAESANVDENNRSAVLRGRLEEGVDENGSSDPGTLGAFMKASNVTVSKDYNFPIDGAPLATWGTITIDIKGKLTVSFVVNSDWKETSVSLSIINDITCNDTEVDIDLPTAAYDVPVGEVPIVVTGIVNFEFVINLRFSGTATGGIRFDFNMRTGMEIGGKIGWSGLDIFVNNKSTMPTTAFRGLSLQGSVFAGFAGGLSLNLFKIFGISAELESGYEVSGKLTSGHYWDGEKKYHACKDFTCIDGDLSYKVLGYSLSVSAGVFSKGISGEFLPSVHITPFYYSGTYDDSAATTCPHWGYRLFVHVRDQNDKAVAGAEVSYDNDDKQYESLKSAKTNSEGIATIYLPEGRHVINFSVKDDTGHVFKDTATFNELGYNEDDLIQPDLYVALDMSRYELSFIDLDQSGEAKNMPRSIHAYSDEQEKTIPDITPTKDGRTFIGWAAEQGSSEVKYKPRDPITVKEDTQLYAVWVNSEYTIKFEANKPGKASNNVEGTMGDQKVQYTGDKEYNLKENQYTLTGWEFTGWSKEPDAAEAEYKDKALISDEDMGGGVEKTVILYAQWEPKTYTVTFGDGNGSTKTQEMKYDTAARLDLNSFTRTDHVFTHWSTPAFGSRYGDGASVTNLCTVNGDGSLTGYTLTANWLETDGATIIITENGKPVDISDPGNSITLKAFNGSEEFTGEFERKDAGIYSIKENSGIPDGTYQVIFSGDLEDYHTADHTIDVSSDPGVYSFDYYTVKISGDGHTKSWIGSEGITEKTKVLVGTQLEIGSETDEGYTFERYTAVGSTPGWEGDNPAEAKQTVTVTGEADIDAHAVANLYQVVFNANDGKTQWTVTQDMVYDEPQKLFSNQFRRYGYKFAGWTKKPEWEGPAACDYTDAQSVVNLTAENNGRVPLYAQWTPAETFIEFDKNAGESGDVKGEMSSQGTFYDSPTKLEKCGFTRDYWDFTGWNTEKDGSGISYPDESKFISDNAENNSTLTLYAQWKPTEYSIAYDLGGGTVLEGNPEAYSIETEDFTLKNPKRVGYIFLGWTGSNGEEPERNVTVPKGSHGDREYKANWEPVRTEVTEDEANGRGTPTGDSFNPLLWGFLLLSSAAALAVLCGRRRNR